MGTTRGVVVLVEGPSDVAALEAVISRAGLPRGVEVRSMGGVTNIRTALAAVLAHEASPRVLGLCDEGEVDVVLRAVRAAGAPVSTAADLPSVGFHTCRGDLEDELIRAVGVDGVVAVLDRAGDLRSFTTLQKQVEWRGQPVVAQLRRFLAAGARRKLRYARLLTDAAAAVDRAPRPLVEVLEISAPIPPARHGR